MSRFILISFFLFSWNVNLSFGMTLRTAVEKAIAYFPQIQAAKASLESSRALISQESSAFSPQIGVEVPLGLEYTREDTKISSMTTTPTHAELQAFRSSPSLNLRQLIYDGGYTSARISKAEFLSEKAYEQYQDTIQEIAFKTASAYLQILRLEKLNNIAAENLTAHQKMLKKTQNLVDAGDLTIADLLQIQARLEDAHLTLTNVKGELVKMRAEFKGYTGIEAVNLEDPKIKSVALNLNRAIQVVLQDNYTLNALKKDRDAVKANLKGVESKFFPTINAEISGNRAQNAGGIKGTRVQGSALLMVRYNLFDGGSRAFEKKSAVSNITEAEKKIATLKLDLEKQTQATWSDIQTLERQEKIFKQAIDYKRQVATSYVKQFDIGARSLLDILNAINDFFLTSALHVNTTVNYQVNCVKLKTLGSQFLQELGVQRLSKKLKKI
ncbi:MAG: TolC family protein [Alphaproteobacteria bacterium]